MTDVVDKQTRSCMMSGIRNKNTAPELLIRHGLHRMGFRYRIHNTHLPGKPDIVLVKYNAVILIHGCFWHKHECHLFKWPKSRPDFWKKKITGNHNNDLRIRQLLENDGWRICTLWECAVKGVKRQDTSLVLDRIAAWLAGNETNLDIPN